MSDHNHDHSHGGEAHCIPMGETVHIGGLYCESEALSCDYEVYSSMVDIDYGNDHCTHKPSCTYAKDEAGEYDAVCMLDPNETICDTHELYSEDYVKCAVAEQSTCSKKGWKDCFEPCTVRVGCEHDPNYCLNTCNSPDGSCKMNKFTCDDLKHLDSNCMHNDTFMELEDYCLSRTNFRISRYVQYGLSPVIFLVFGCFLVRKTHNILFKDSLSYLDTILSGFFYALMSGLCFLYTFVLAVDYSYASDWEFSGVVFSPVWLIYTFVGIIIFALYHATYFSIEYNKKNKKLARSITSIEYVVEAMMWAAAMGVQTSLGGSWFWSVITWICLCWGMVRSFGEESRTTQIIIGVTTAIVVPVTHYVVGEILITPLDAKATSGILITIAALQMVLSTIQLMSVWEKNNENMMNAVWLSVVTVVAYGLNIMFFYVTPIEKVAWKELTIAEALSSSF